MEIYFVYSDEYGCYTKEKKEKFIQSHPYYIRSVVILKAIEWKSLEHKIIALKQKYSLPLDREIKWNYLWSLRSHSKNEKPIKKTDEYFFLRDFDYREIIKYVDDCLKQYHELVYRKIFFTITKNSTVGRVSEDEMYKMHLMNIAQRLQYEFQKENDLAVLYLDTVSQKSDDRLKNAWNEIYKNGDFVKKYSTIKSSAYIEYSHQSVGVQIADYTAGAIGSFLKGLTNNNYQKGVDMFNNYVLPNLRRYNDKYVGAGVLNVPTQQDFKEDLMEMFDKT